MGWLAGNQQMSQLLASMSMGQLQPQGSRARPGQLPAELWGVLSWWQWGVTRPCRVSKCCCGSREGGYLTAPGHSPETDQGLSLTAVLI